MLIASCRRRRRPRDRQRRKAEALARLDAMLFGTPQMRTPRLRFVRLLAAGTGRDPSSLSG